MKRPLLVRGARQLLTLRGSEGPRRGAETRNLGVINDGSVLIRDGRIVSVGQSRRVENLAEARQADVLEAHGAVVMPGFVDASAAMPEQALRQRCLAQLAGRHGTTLMGAGIPYARRRVFEAIEGREVPMIPLLQLEPGFDDAHLTRLLRQRAAAILCADLREHSREALRFLHSLGTGILARAPRGEAAGDWLGLALAFGAAAVEPAAELTRAQAELLADSEASAVLTPATVGAARGLIDAGAAVALGSGFRAGGASTCSMQAAAALAVRDGQLDMAEAVTMATINAAHALNAGGECGSLEAGKRADLLILHLSDYREIPAYLGVNVVSKIFQAGKLVS